MSSPEPQLDDGSFDPTDSPRDWPVDGGDDALDSPRRTARVWPYEFCGPPTPRTPRHQIRESGMGVKLAEFRRVEKLLNGTESELMRRNDPRIIEWARLDMERRAMEAEDFGFERYLISIMD